MEVEEYEAKADLESEEDMINTNTVASKSNYQSSHAIFDTLFLYLTLHCPSHIIDPYIINCPYSYAKTPSQTTHIPSP